MRPRVLNVLSVVALVPTVVVGVQLTGSDPDAAYRLSALVGFLLLAACTVPLTLAIVSTVVAHRDDRAGQAPAAVGMGFAVALALVTVPTVVDRVAAWIH